MVSPGLKNGDAAAAAGHHHQAGLHHVPDGLDFHDGLGPGGGHHPAVAPAGVLDDVIASLGHHALGLLPGHKGPDGLGGVPEGGVVRVHLHLGQHRGHPLGDAPVQHLLPQAVLQIIADVALAHGYADRQRTGNILVRVGAGQLGHGLLDHPHLRSVSVGDDHLVPLLDEVHDGPGGLLYGDHLLRQVVAQRVATQGDNDSFTHISIIPPVLQ